MSALRYRLSVETFGCAAEPVRHRSQQIDNLSLTRAWKLAMRAARRGRNIHGGEVLRTNWGVRGGQFPARYRSAVIKMDTGAKRRWGRG